MKKIKVLHLATHLNVGGITTYIYLLGKTIDPSECEIAVLSSGGNMTEKFRSSGIRTFELPIKTKSELSPKIYFSIPKVIELIHKEGFDLIHAHTRVTQMMAWWIERLTGIPFVTTCHGFYKKRLGRRLISAWGKKVIAISAPVEDDLITRFKVSRDKVQTIFNAVDIRGLEERKKAQNIDAIRKEWGLKPDTRVIGIVSRIVQDKGHEYLVAAFHQLITKRPNMKLLIVGEGPFKPKVMQLVKRLNLESNVVFTGNLIDVTKALAVIDIFVLPAIWREGFGLSIIEAMALKIPAIVTNIWALNALVRDRDNGLLIPPKSTDELACAVNEFIEKPEFAKFIGVNGYETVKKEFAIERMAAELANLYIDVLPSRPLTPKVGLV